MVDTTPDLRQQLLANQITQLDAVIITHEHADHTHGIDDLRPLSFNRAEPLAVYSHHHCCVYLKHKFPYIFQADTLFKHRPILGGGIPKLSLKEINLAKSTNQIAEEDFTFHLLPHGYTKTLSFIHDKMAYVIDCQTLGQEWVEKLKTAKLDLLILDCVKDTPHQTHLHLEASLKFAQKIGAAQTGLIHMGHELEHESLSNELKSLSFKVFPLYDSQQLFYSTAP